MVLPLKKELRYSSQNLSEIIPVITQYLHEIQRICKEWSVSVFENYTVAVIFGALGTSHDSSLHKRGRISLP